MFTMWYSAMHRGPNSWGIQAMNTLVCIHLLNFSSENWNGMHAVVIMCAVGVSALPTSYGENKPDYPLAWAGWELFYGAGKSIILPKCCKKKIVLNQMRSYHPATYIVQITSYHWAIYDHTHNAHMQNLSLSKTGTSFSAIILLRGNLMHTPQCTYTPSCFTSIRISESFTSLAITRNESLQETADHSSYIACLMWRTYMFRATNCDVLHRYGVMYLIKNSYYTYIGRN